MHTFSSFYILREKAGAGVSDGFVPGMTRARCWEPHPSLWALSPAHRATSQKGSTYLHCVCRASCVFEMGNLRPWLPEFRFCLCASPYVGAYCDREQTIQTARFSSSTGICLFWVAFHLFIFLSFSLSIFPSGSLRVG